MQNNQDREKNLTQQEKVRPPVVIDMSQEISIDQELQFLVFEEKIIKSNIDNQLKQIKTKSEGNEEFQSLDSKLTVGALQKEINNILQELITLRKSYESVLIREDTYLQEIRQLKSQLVTQKTELSRTYSYRLGYILIHSTKSIRNFLRLPKDLISLYFENKRRKNKKKIKN